MPIIETLVEVGAALVVADWLVRRRSEEAAREVEPIPVPVRSRH